ncbi:MAG: putative porin, partial [Thermodesulfobacteriota bacterium]|nr:putative porin [Thermodesulfobacteriota bacterium]
AIIKPGVKLTITGIMILISGLIFSLAASGPVFAEESRDDILRRLEELTRTVNRQQETLRRQAEAIRVLREKLESQEAASKSGRTRPDQAAQKTKEKSKRQDRLSLSTDLRLRCESIANRKAGGAELDDRNRVRMRWRIFGDFKVADGLSLHSMLTTSSGKWFDNGTGSRSWQPGRTANQTMDDEFNNKDVFLGRMYVTWKPKPAPGLEITAGKFKNTFLTTDIMWDSDVNPEGIYERYQWGRGHVRPFIHFGQMVVAENNRTDDAYLFIRQIGSEFLLGKKAKLTLAASHYDWQDLNQSNMSQVQGSSAGNSLGADGKYLYEYELVHGLTFLDFRLGGLPVKLWLDYIINTADDVPDGQDTAWSTGFMLGKAKKKGDWALSLKYAGIESDAVVGAVIDGDFYGTNRIGYKVQGRYQILDPVQFRLSWFQTDALDGPENKEDRFQADLIFKFGL